MKEKRKTPSLATDIIITNKNQLVLIKRAKDPYKDKWALPGGFIENGETHIEAAEREAKEETNLDVEIEWLVGVYSDPARDPRGHVISIAMSGSSSGKPEAATDAAEARWHPIDKLPELAFDHEKIINDYLEIRR